MRTTTRGALAGLLLGGALLAINARWGELNGENAPGSVRHGYSGAERTHDDRQRHTVRIFVERGQPARELGITWGIGEEGDRVWRSPKDRAEWEEVRTGVPDGTVVTLAGDNYQRAGRLICDISVDDESVDHFDDFADSFRGCELNFTVGGRVGG